MIDTVSPQVELTEPDMTNRQSESEERPERIWWVVAVREMSVKVRNRGFLVSTLVTLGLILGALGLQMYLGTAAQKVTVAGVRGDGRPLVAQAGVLAGQSDQKAVFSWQAADSASAVRAAVLDGRADVGLLPTSDGGWQLVGRTDRNSAASVWIGAAVQQSALDRNAAASGTTAAALARGGGLGYSLLAPARASQSVVMITTYVFGFLFYLAAVLLGVSLATSVVEEKQNRIVEIIAGSIRLRDLLTGKVLGNTVLGLGQMAVFALAALVGLLGMGKSDVLRQISPGLGWFLLFYGVGIAVLACVFAAAGALATRSEDIQSVTTPVSALVAVVFIVGISASGTLRTVLSFVPLTSTITMPGRIVAGQASWWEAAAALLVSAATAGLVMALAERIYRRALMQTGGKLSFRQALRLSE